MQLFYTKKINNNIAILEEEEARHATQVLRRKVGDSLQLTDGLGNFYEGTIADVQKKVCLVSIADTINEYHKRPFKLHIAIAPTKNIDRYEWFLEKATEIGIDEITPIICKNSERTIVKLDRLNTILLSAMKQSLKAYLPKLNEAIDFQKFIKKDFPAYNQKLIAHCYDDNSKFQISNSSNNIEIRNPKSEIKYPLSILYQKGENCVIVIGPEGDFSIDELGLAFEEGYKGIGLGNSRLRTETAGVVACHTVNLLNDV
jgi:16S rRNA (uracil1498-N3)-methyltransferase